MSHCSLDVVVIQNSSAIRTRCPGSEVETTVRCYRIMMIRFFPLTAGEELPEGTSDQRAGDRRGRCGPESRSRGNNGRAEGPVRGHHPQEQGGGWDLVPQEGQPLLGSLLIFPLFIRFCSIIYYILCITPYVILMPTVGSSAVWGQRKQRGSALCPKWAQRETTLPAGSGGRARQSSQTGTTLREHV